MAAILIDYTETLEKSERVFSGDLSLKDAAARLRISVGSIRRLRDGGYLKQIKARNPDTQHYRCYITEESIQAFAEVYVTLGQMAEKIELAAIHLARALDRREIETIPCDAGFVRAYPKKTRNLVRDLAMVETGQPTPVGSSTS
ncbi:helix-turn-helix domain-containing protein [Ruegeria denitrificans]|uniref:helix-turn-helix domain-containing protein n=1 Tax=Ruegeria denitrificans TaxID=1715692 RepID=UPI000AFC862B|nr:helix-turn-helix domain-containing protein [Ruegeria denitrificans]